MSIVLFCLGLLSLTGGGLAEIWEFGVDAPGSIVIDHREGDFSLFEKTKEIKLKVSERSSCQVHFFYPFAREQPGPSITEGPSCLYVLQWFRNDNKRNGSHYK